MTVRDCLPAVFLGFLLGLLPALAPGRGHVDTETVPALPRLVAAGEQPAAGMLLVARRNLADPLFARSVVLLLSHDAHGSLGLVLNRRTDSTLSDALSGINNPQGRQHPLFVGGPLGTDRVFMLIRDPGALPHTRHVVGDIYFSADRDVLDVMLDRNTPPSELQFYLGYASWVPGQLAAEIAHGSWQLTYSDSVSIFGEANHTLWQRLINELEPLGIEVKREGSLRDLVGMACLPDDFGPDFMRRPLVHDFNAALVQAAQVKTRSADRKRLGQQGLAVIDVGEAFSQ